VATGRTVLSTRLDPTGELECPFTTDSLSLFHRPGPDELVDKLERLVTGDAAG
jgi:hypothetical protein